MLQLEQNVSVQYEVSEKIYHLAAVQQTQLTGGATSILQVLSHQSQLFKFQSSHVSHFASVQFTQLSIVQSQHHET
jgi:hypothetical protein